MAAPISSQADLEEMFRDAADVKTALTVRQQKKRGVGRRNKNKGREDKMNWKVSIHDGDTGKAVMRSRWAACTHVLERCAHKC